MAEKDVLIKILEYLSTQLDKIQDEKDKMKSLVIATTAIANVAGMCAGAIKTNEEKISEKESVIYNESEKTQSA